MKERNVLIGLIVVLCLVAVIIKVVPKQKELADKQENNQADALKFKNEYESLNGKETDNKEHNYREVSIPEDNPFVYITAEDLAKKIDDKENFVVYFGFDTCPWCRSVISTLAKVANDLEVKKIYYVSIKDIRDTKEVNDEGKVETTKEGSQGYYDLIDKLSDVLSDYTLTDKDDKEVSGEEKRIYAPNVVSVIEGKALKLVEGNSKDQTDAYQELTDEMVNETYSTFEDLLKEYKEKDSLCTKKGC